MTWPTSRDDEEAARSAGYFPRRFLTDFLKFIRDHSADINLLTYDSLPWGDDSDYEGGTERSGHEPGAREWRFGLGSAPTRTELGFAVADEHQRGPVARLRAAADALELRDAQRLDPRAARGELGVEGLRQLGSRLVRDLP